MATALPVDAMAAADAGQDVLTIENVSAVGKIDANGVLTATFICNGAEIQIIRDLKSKVDAKELKDLQGKDIPVKLTDAKIERGKLTGGDVVIQFNSTVTVTLPATALEAPKPAAAVKPKPTPAPAPQKGNQQTKLVGPFENGAYHVIIGSPKVVVKGLNEPGHDIDKDLALEIGVTGKRRISVQVFPNKIPVDPKARAGLGFFSVKVSVDGKPSRDMRLNLLPEGGEVIKGTPSDKEGQWSRPFQFELDVEDGFHAVRIEAGEENAYRVVIHNADETAAPDVPGVTEAATGEDPLLPGKIQVNARIKYYSAPAPGRYVLEDPDGYITPEVLAGMTVAIKPKNGVGAEESIEWVEIKDAKGNKWRASGPFAPLSESRLFRPVRRLT
ncbi:hypothetical protein HYV58_00825 [Candidatus Peregrinibacteria bacterium]|nr:hypothetical protein [Candidatus Peregrinibacteria bacterium]